MNSTVKTIMFWAFIVICLVLLFSVVVREAGMMSGKEAGLLLLPKRLHRKGSA